ncbi:hypothetical protein VD0002_g8447 [Verticillium dahliae]|uniref:Uncharacterized protein n=1 Tax=Verticillium dahliae TaxID=27337 RepID=A0A2J8CSB8_VERDA|nr:hypothetical protein VdG2_00142 [Verticillium dahliae VDG2]KAF3353361.1 hypothetical protein VdG1_08412 [Verticillium dahliae VDG1]PNH29402.1 hypothetical protein BJF96_g7396 [Verticillium dahliae]PNH39911.1 hypothetical protein VD0004_g7037 [Verticillium dahliae]PNH47181.1 hypothetical protein VD0003_g8870 [Verticillium dahliae]
MPPSGETAGECGSRAPPQNAQALLESDIWEAETGPGNTNLNVRIMNMAESGRGDIEADDLQRIVNSIEAMQAEMATKGLSDKKRKDLAKLVELRNKHDIHSAIQPNAKTLIWSEFKKQGREPTLEEALRMSGVMRAGELPSTKHLFRGPGIVRDVPIKPIKEDDPYWDPEWLSLNSSDFSISNWRDKLRDSWRRQKATAGTATADDKEKFRLEQRQFRSAISEIRLIRKCFLEGVTIHPNQLISKKFMPKQGLCKRWLLYSICLKLTRLLAIRHDTAPGAIGLHMSPIDFIR